jgi:hypothetical protein
VHSAPGLRRAAHTTCGRKGRGGGEAAASGEPLHPYCGKDYSRAFTEVISMGMEWMYADPLALAEDPEYFDLIWATMEGT